MKCLLILLSVLTAIAAQNAHNSDVQPTTKTYVCPRRFVRVGRRCYFFSKNSATWQDAYHQCRDRKSNIAIIKTANQDKRIRKILFRPTHAIRERWLGGMYNWKQMKWLWASTGKPLGYHGFASQNFTESQKWHCIIMDPALDYKWNTRPCIEKKPYICHTKSKVVTRTDISKNDPDRNLNEIPASNFQYQKIPANLKAYSSDLQFKTNENDVPRISPRQKRRRNNRRKKKIANTTLLLHRPKYTALDSRDIKFHSTNRTVDGNQTIPMETIKYEIYKEEPPLKNSLYPKPIIEEYSFMRQKQ
ncbi:hypothetical protein HHI36_006078 [Cryptolaemus montrouzieri]|uniref:C-type lectin domain-containing protein n=1 Tax=Cryptolaemus montrouzieri TaxID=559131 RepID=A0ABD2NXF4_9CUCU